MTEATRTTTTTKAHVQGTTTLGPYTEGNDNLKRTDGAAGSRACHEQCCQGRRMQLAADLALVPAAGGTKWKFTRNPRRVLTWEGAAPGSITKSKLLMHKKVWRP
jgi:hypothetical protein